MIASPGKIIRAGATSIMNLHFDVDDQPTIDPTLICVMLTEPVPAFMLRYFHARTEGSSR